MSGLGISILVTQGASTGVGVNPGIPRVTFGAHGTSTHSGCQKGFKEESPYFYWSIEKVDKEERTK